MKRNTFFIILLVTALNISCVGTGPLVYQPNSPLIPEHQKKGDKRIRIATLSETVAVSASKALTNHTYLSVETSYVFFKAEHRSLFWNNIVYYNKFNHFSWFVETGYYNVLNFNTANLIYGMGFGSGANHINSIYRRYNTGSIPLEFVPDFKGTLLKTGITPFINLTNRYLSIGFSSRFSYVFRTNSPQYPFSALFWEPTYRMKVGNENVGIYWQGTMSLPLYENIYEKFDYHNMIITLGLEINLSKRKK